MPRHKLPDKVVVVTGAPAPETERIFGPADALLTFAGACSDRTSTRQRTPRRRAVSSRSRVISPASFPLGRIGQPDDVAEAALYLASGASSWVTGVVLDVAGGKIVV
jgi:NAD(P)-dependent dehydrogenase (short-subunit alcohol dehydrogenase family)